MKGFPGGLVVKNSSANARESFPGGKESTPAKQGTQEFPGLGRSHGEGHGNPLQYLGLIPV